MASHSEELIAEIIPLMRHTRDQAGQWVGFTVDDPPAYAAAMRWIVHNPHSPVASEFAQYKANSVVIEWKHDSQWGKTAPQYPPRTLHIGRVRLRTPRTDSKDTK